MEDVFGKTYSWNETGYILKDGSRCHQWKKGVVAVTALKTGRYKYHAHRILTPDGTVFILEQRKSTEPTISSVSSKTARKGEAIGSMPSKTVSQNSTVVKDEFDNDTHATFSPSLSATDEEYLAAVNSGDMETARRMVDEAAKAAGYPERGYRGSKKGGGA